MSASQSRQGRKFMRQREEQVREGTRGGRAYFNWEDVKVDAKHRENYLGHSIHAAVGRSHKNRDLQWYTKANDLVDDKLSGNAAGASNDAARIAAEMEAVRQREVEMMAQALGVPVGQLGTSGSAVGRASPASATLTTASAMASSSNAAPLGPNMRRKDVRSDVDAEKSSSKHKHKESKKDKKSKSKKHHRHRRDSDENERRSSRSRSRSRSRERRRSRSPEARKDSREDSHANSSHERDTRREVSRQRRREDSRERYIRREDSRERYFRRDDSRERHSRRDDPRERHSHRDVDHARRQY